MCWCLFCLFFCFFYSGKYKKTENRKRKTEKTPEFPFFFSFHRPNLYGIIETGKKKFYGHRNGKKMENFFEWKIQPKQNKERERDLSLFYISLLSPLKLLLLPQSFPFPFFPIFFERFLTTYGEGEEEGKS